MPRAYYYQGCLSARNAGGGAGRKGGTKGGVPTHIYIYMTFDHVSFDFGHHEMPGFFGTDYTVRESSVRLLPQ